MLGPRVCYIISKTEGGTWAFEQLRELKNRFNYDVSVILNGSKGTLVDRFKNEGIRVYEANFDFTRAFDLFTLPRKILKLVKLLRKEQFDVLHTHLFNSMVIGRIAGWLADAPVRLSMIAGPLHLEAATPWWIDKMTCWMDTLIVPSCEYSLQLYKQMGVSEKRLSLVYYGPDEHRFDCTTTPKAGLREEFDWPEDTPLIGMIAYFYPKLETSRWTPKWLHGKALKGHEYLIESAADVLQEFPNAKFLLIGGGWGVRGEEVKQDMQALVTSLKLENSVFFTGHRTDIPNIYRDLNVSVQASLSENLGGTIEALLMECPTVVTKVGGLVDTVLDGKTGVLVNAADSTDMARGILQLLRDPEKAQLLGKAGREYMLEKFTLRSTVDDLDALYKKNYKNSAKNYRLHKTAFRLIILSFFSLFVSLRFILFDIFWHSVKSTCRRLFNQTKIGRRLGF